MNRLLIRKVMGESALLFAACGTLVFSFCWVRVWIACQFDLQQFAPLLKQLKPFERFSPVPLEQFLTYAGSIGMTFHEPALILCIIVWAIARGSDVVSGELGRGTLEILLSRPISRTRLLTIHAMVCSVGLAALCGLAWLGIATGIQTNSVRESITPTMELKVPFLPARIPVPLGAPEEVSTPLSALVSPNLYIAPTINLFGLGFFILALSSMCSCFDRYRWRTIGVVISVYILQLLAFLLSRATPATEALKYGTFFSLFQPDGMVQLVLNRPDATFEMVSSGSVPGWHYLLGPAGMSLSLILLGLVCYLAGWWRLSKRDLPAPL